MLQLDWETPTRMKNDDMKPSSDRKELHVHQQTHTNICAIAVDPSWSNLVRGVAKAPWKEPEIGQLCREEHEMMVVMQRLGVSFAPTFHARSRKPRFGKFNGFAPISHGLSIHSIDCVQYLNLFLSMSVLSICFSQFDAITHAGAYWQPESGGKQHVTKVAWHCGCALKGWSKNLYESLRASIYDINTYLLLDGPHFAVS